MPGGNVHYLVEKCCYNSNAVTLQLPKIYLHHCLLLLAPIRWLVFNIGNLTNLVCWSFNIDILEQLLFSVVFYRFFITYHVVFVHSYCTMSWCRAVWQEGRQEEEGVVPACWIEQKFVRWPKVSNATKLLQERCKPSASWWRFPLVKIKCRSGVFLYSIKWQWIMQVFVLDYCC